MVVFVCEASSVNGYGHLKRCLALAVIYRRLGLPVLFVMPGILPAVRDLLDERRVSWTVRPDLPACFDWLEENRSRVRLCVIDHYGIDADREKTVFGLFPVVVLDDLCRSHWCDMLVDQTLGRRPSDYEGKLCHGPARVLAGSRYIIMDPMYQGIRTRGDGRRVLITFGATDPVGAGLKVLDMLEAGVSRTDLVFHMPLSSVSPWLASLKDRAKQSRLDIRVYPDPPDLRFLYQECGVAVGAPGTSVMERMYCGLINLTVTVMDNHAEVGQILAREGLVIGLGEIKTLDSVQMIRELNRLADEPDYGEDLRQRGMGVVDGNGPLRIVGRTASLIAPVVLRPAGAGDRDTLYAWQHEPGARQYSRNPSPPGPEEHASWFRGFLAREDGTLLIIEWDGRDVGFVRLDGREGKTEVSILVSRPFQGLGFAGAALRKALEPCRRYVAEIHPDNRASVRLFLSAGFCQTQNGTYHYGPEIR